MAIALTIQQLLDYLGGTGAASPRTFYGLTVPDATITSRALTPANAWINDVAAAATITAKTDIATSAALARAAQLLLGHLRTLLLAGGKVDSYSIGDMSVTKQNLLQLLNDGVAHERDAEGQMLVLLLGAGTRKDQGDLTIENPIEVSDGTSRINLDSPPYGGYI